MPLKVESYAAWEQQGVPGLLSVVIPAHNEAGNIEDTVTRLVRTLGEAGIHHEILVVNDNSTDDTEPLLQRLQDELPSVRYVNNDGENGFGFAVRVGLSEFRGDAVAVFMADCSDDPRDLVRFYNRLREGYDCVFGTRFGRGGKVIDYPWPKLVLNRLGNWLIQLLFVSDYNDTTNAFKLYRREVIAGLSPLLSHHFNLLVELPLKSIVRGYRYAVVPNSWHNRKRGISKFKIREMGSRYLFIILYCLIEKLLSRGDYSRRGKPREVAGPAAASGVLKVARATEGLIMLGAGALFFLAAISLGGAASTPSLDPSWAQALGEAFRRSLLFGEDIVFTYGPWSYFQSPNSPYIRELFPGFIATQALLTLAYGLVLFGNLYRLQSRLERFLILCVILLIGTGSPPTLPYVAIPAAVALAVDDRWKGTRLGTTMLVLVPALFAFVALGKFSHFPLAVLGTLAIAACHLAPIRSRSAVPVAVFSGAVGVLWIAGGQTLGNLWPFLRESFILASAYSDGMSLAFKPSELFLALVAMGLFVLLVAFHVQFSGRDRAALAVAVTSLGALFLAWKVGFVRQDGHTANFHYFVTFGAFWVSFDHAGWLRRVGLPALRFSIVALGMLGLTQIAATFDSSLADSIRHNVGKAAYSVRVLPRIDELSAQREVEVEMLRTQYALPKTNEIVGDFPIDVVSVQQGILFLNRLNWAPRPVFQSYAALTDSLLDLNGDFFSGPHAPPFVLLSLVPIDNRFPMTCDSQTLLHLLRDYRLRSTEGEYLLLKRRPAPKRERRNRKVLAERRFALGEVVDLGRFADRPYLVELDIRPTAIGRLMKLVYRYPPDLNLHVEATDGWRRSYRLVPGIAGGPFLLNPLVLKTDDFKAWYKRRPLRRLARFRVTLEGERPWSVLQEEIGLRVIEFDFARGLGRGRPQPGESDG